MEFRRPKLKCSESANGTQRRLAGSAEFGSDRGTADMPRASQASRSVATEPPRAQPTASLIAVSKLFASKAGILWIRPRRWVDGEREHRLRIRGIDDVDEIVVALRVVDRLYLDAQFVELCLGLLEPFRKGYPGSR